MKRVFDPDNPELMDRPQPVSAALERDLENLRGLNRWFGANRILKKVLEPELRAIGRASKTGPVGKFSENRLIVADLCSGSGDLPKFMARLGRKGGVSVQIEAVEGHPATWEIGRDFCADTPEITFVQADVREWEPATTPDWVVCSLALHHFTESEALKILTKMWKIARCGVLLADLERNWWATAGIYTASVFYREPMTVEDMRRSAKAAFSHAELAQMTAAAGWQNVRHERFFYGRQAAWATKSPI